MVSLEERFWTKVNKTETCWLWTSAKTAEGYGPFWDGRSTVQAHRFSYERLVGPIPDGLVIDHLCRVRHCVNPDHLEPVTQQVNTQRQGPQPSNTSGFRGVFWHEQSQKWRASVKCDGRTYSGGYFSDSLLAADAAEALRAQVFSGDTSKWDAPRGCMECGNSLAGLRVDAKFCSDRCRGINRRRQTKGDN